MEKFKFPGKDKNSLSFPGLAATVYKIQNNKSNFPGNFPNINEFKTCHLNDFKNLKTYLINVK